MEKKGERMDHRMTAAEYNRLASAGAIKSGGAGRRLSLDARRMARMAAWGGEPIEPGPPKKRERPGPGVVVVQRAWKGAFALGFFLGVIVTLLLAWGVLVP
jgi:hypothetical protein